MPVTVDQLRQAQAEFEVADASREATRERRLELVRQARDEGWTQREISEAMGLTRGRINQLA